MRISLSLLTWYAALCVVAGYIFAPEALAFFFGK